MPARLFRQVVSFACTYLLWSVPSLSQVPVVWRDSSDGSTRGNEEARRDHAEKRRGEERREAWLLSIEGVTHAPLDWGLAIGLQTPPGLRVSGGLGWVPGSYMSLLTGVAANASGDGYAQALLEHGDYDGRTWRVQIGFRPFRSLGLYADVGYARVNADGTLDLEDSGVSVLEALGGRYRATTKLDMWLVELGYQGQVAERLVLGIGLGAMGTMNATTTLVAVDGARSDRRLLGAIATDTDAALEKYGVIPTLTLRLGFDLI
jgi:hypothetical protein